jgi:uncharacterized membrane protein YqaE (UPF0057 family)
MAEKTNLIALIFALIFPPVSVALTSGIGVDLIINCLLTLLAFIPGMIHAFWIVLRNQDGTLPR